MLAKIMTYFFGLIALLVLLFILLTLVGWDKVWERTVGSADLGAVEFEGLKKRRTPNQALVCPDGLCHESDRDFAAPTYKIAASELSEQLLASLQVEQRLERVDDGADPMRLRFVQRTKLMRFPDTINVKIIPLEDRESTLAIYSRSQIGKSDLGVNLARVKRWLKRLREFEV